MTVDTSVQKLILSEDFSRIKNKGIIVGAENVDRPIQFVSKTSLQDELETEKQAEKKFSYESLSQHLGRPLDDVAKRFGSKFGSTMLILVYLIPNCVPIFFLK